MQASEVKTILAEVGITKSDECYEPALVLLMSVAVGPSAVKCHKGLNGAVGRAKVRSIGKKLRDNGIWDGEFVNCAIVDSKEAGDTGFLMDVMVGAGKFVRDLTKEGQYSYSAA